MGKQIEAVLVKEDTNYWLYDLGREEVGYLTVRVKSDRKQKLSIRWGEHIVDGSTGSYQHGTKIDQAFFLGTYEISRKHMKRIAKFYYGDNLFRMPEKIIMKLYVI